MEKPEFQMKPGVATARYDIQRRTEPISLLIPPNLEKALQRLLRKKKIRRRTYFETVIRDAQKGAYGDLPFAASANPRYQVLNNKGVKRGCRVHRYAWQEFKLLAKEHGFSACHLFRIILEKDLKSSVRSVFEKAEYWGRTFFKAMFNRNTGEIRKHFFNPAIAQIVAQIQKE